MTQRQTRSAFAIEPSRNARTKFLRFGGPCEPRRTIRHCEEFSDAAAGRKARRRERTSRASRPAREDVADYRPGLRSGSTPALATPLVVPADRLAGDAALYVTSVRRRWDQQCLSRFRSRSALRLVVNAVRTCPGCHLGADT